MLILGEIQLSKTLKPMDKEEIALVTQSWSQIITDQEAVGKLFYKRLFELDPSLSNLFQPDITEQARKFVSMITYLIYKLDDLDGVLMQAVDLGKRHQSYRVSLKDFDTVHQAFFETLEKSGSGVWNDQVHRAWDKVYALFEQAMKEGYRLMA